VESDEMPKMKSNRSAAKRFRKTATGRVRYKRGFKNHILTKKSAKRIRQLRKVGLLNAGDEKRVKDMLPYL
jgi:large subunit ribosomal protein L35